MAKHKKPAPAARKKPSAKPSKPARSAKASKSSRPSAASKPAKAHKPAKPAKAVKPAKPARKKAAPPPKSAKPAKAAPATKNAKPSKRAPTTPKKVPLVPAKKNTSSAKPAAKSAAKPAAPAKAPAKPASNGKVAPAPAPAPAPKAAAKPAAAPARAVEKTSGKTKARDLLRSRILGSKKASKPIAFSLDEVREIAKTAKVATPETAPAAPKPAAPAKPRIDLTKLEKPAQPSHVKAASLADILGFNPKKAQKPANVIDPESVPEKYRRYYKLLLELRAHLTAGIELHSEETLKRSSKDDAGDLSSYGQHMADAGTDTFDRDFALSLVSSEQEALAEIEAAIKRIHNGTYGICEATQKPIAKERLLAVPFTRYSAEAQKEIERNRMRTRSAAGLFGELGEEGAKLSDDGGDDE